MSNRGKYVRMYCWKHRCEVCRKRYESTRPDKKTCGPTCRKAKSRGGIKLFNFKPVLKWG